MRTVLAHTSNVIVPALTESVAALLDDCGSSADFEALLIASEVTAEYCTMLTSQAIALDIASSTGHDRRGKGADGDTTDDATSSQMRPDVGLARAVGKGSGHNLRHGQSNRSNGPHGAPGARAHLAYSSLRSTHNQRIARARRQRGAPTLCADPRISLQWAYPSERELKGAPGRNSTLGRAPAGGSTHSGVGETPGLDTFVSTSTGYSLRRWGAVGILVLDLMRCASAGTVKRTGVGFGEAQWRWLQTVLELEPPPPCASVSARASSETASATGRAQSLELRSARPPLTTLLVVCEVPLAGDYDSGSSSDAGSAQQRSTAPELHSVLALLFEWRAAAAGRHFALLSSGLGLAMDTEVLEFESSGGLRATVMQHSLAPMSAEPLVSRESVALSKAEPRTLFNAQHHAWIHRPLHTFRAFSLLHAVVHPVVPTFTRRDVHSTRVAATVGPIVGEVTSSTATVLLEVSAPIRLELVLVCGANGNTRRVARWCEPHVPVAFHMKSLEPDCLYTFQFEPLMNSIERSGYFRTMPLRPVIFRLAAVGALPPLERLTQMAKGRMPNGGAKSHKPTNGCFFASVVASDELRTTPAAVGAGADTASDEIASLTPWRALADETLLPQTSFSLVVQLPSSPCGPSLVEPLMEACGAGTAVTKENSDAAQRAAQRTAISMQETGDLVRSQRRKSTAGSFSPVEANLNPGAMAQHQGTPSGSVSVDPSRDEQGGGEGEEEEQRIVADAGRELTDRLRDAYRCSWNLPFLRDVMRRTPSLMCTVPDSALASALEPLVDASLQPKEEALNATFRGSGFTVEETRAKEGKVRNPAVMALRAPAVPPPPPRG